MRKRNALTQESVTNDEANPNPDLFGSARRMRNGPAKTGQHSKSGVCMSEEDDSVLRIIAIGMIVMVIIALLTMLTGCAVVYPRSDGYAGATFLANSKRIEVSKTGGSIDEANVTGPVMAAGAAATAVVMAGPAAGAL